MQIKNRQFISLIILLAIFWASPISALSQEVNLLPGVRLFLPDNGQVKVNWVLPPLDSSLFEEYGDKIHFSVDDDGVPLIGLGDRLLINPVKEYSGVLSVNYENFFHLSSGLLLFSTDEDFGFIYPAKDLDYDPETGLSIFPYQPVALMPESQELNDGYRVSERIMFRGENCIYFLITRTSEVSSALYIQNVIYCLKSENITAKDGEDRKALFFQPVLITEKENPVNIDLGLINAVAGNGETTYFSRNNRIFKLEQRSGQPELFYEHPEGKFIQSLEFSREVGLVYTTYNSVGLADQDRGLEFIRTQVTPIIYLQKNRLYVLLSDGAGLIRLDNLDVLRKYNTSEREIKAVNGTKYRSGASLPVAGLIVIISFLVFYVLWLVALIDVLKADFHGPVKMSWLLMLLLAYISLIMVFVSWLFLGWSGRGAIFMLISAIIVLSYLIMGRKHKL